MKETAAIPGAAHLNVQFEALFERSLDAVVGMDIDGRVIAWNSAAEEMFGWTAAEAMGQLMSEMIIPHQHRRAHETGLKKYRITGQGRVLNTRIQIEARRRTGQEFPVELSILPLEHESQRVFYAFIRSREEEVRTIRERERRAREAEVLAAISAAQLEDLDTGDFIRLCLRQICELSGFSVGHSYRVDNPVAPSLLIPTGLWHFEDDKFRAAATITETFAFPRGEGLPGRVWEAEAPVVIESIARDPYFTRRDPFLQIGLVKGFAFPLRNCGSLSGVMEFFGPTEARTERDLIHFVDIVGSHVELALQRQAEFDQREMLRRELSHRVGNSLAVLGSLFRRCCATASSVAELRASFEPRLLAVGHAHRLIGGHQASHVDLHQIVHTAVDLLPETGQVSVEGPEVTIDPKHVLPITLILHELVTNSIKHGQWHRTGSLQVAWSVEPGDRLRLTWRESPAAPPPDEVGQGYGSVLMRAMAEGTMGGNLSRRFEDGAFLVTLETPLI